jgi:3',5'-cyclic AMP phosphodiesterase CpdA
MNVVFHEIRASDAAIAGRFEVTRSFAIEAIERVGELVARSGLELRVFLDDGDLTHYDFALGLAERRIGVSLALVTSAIDSPGHLSTLQVTELAKVKGVELLSHGVTHVPLAGEPGRSRREVGFQLSESRKALAELGIDAREFVYPYGIYSPEVVEMTGEVYRGAYTCDQGVEDSETPRLMKPRTVIDRRRSPAEWHEIVGKILKTQRDRSD